MKLIDVIFAIYIAIVLPLATLFYFAIAITDFPPVFIALGAIILWAIMIPYPLYRYVKIRFIA